MKFIFFFLFFFFYKLKANTICKNNYLHFLIEKNKKEILIIEKYNMHGECLPGFIKYFIDIGYNNIDILINENLLKLNPLNISLINNKINIFAYSLTTIENFIELGVCDYYKICFFNSFGYDKKQELNKNFKFKKLTVIHNLNFINKKNENNYNIIVLKNFYKNNSFYEINPHYFGEYKFHNKSKKITNFITVGNIENFRKNYNILFNNVKELIKNNIFNFHVTIIGRILEKSIKNIVINKNLSNYITLTGRIPYDEMFQKISQADFFLPLLDSKKHIKYLKEKTSGSFQLVYGFNIPMVIEKIFAEKYGFDNKNSVIYFSEKNFFYKLNDSINMKNEEYQKLKYNLKIKAKEIEKNSLENLKILLNK